MSPTCPSGRTDFTIEVCTDNPDFVAKFKTALERVGLDLDLNGEPHHMSVAIFQGTECLFGTEFAPDSEHEQEHKS